MKRVKKEVDKKEVDKKEVDKKEVDKNLKEIKKLTEDIKKYSGEYQKCVSNICVDEKVALMKDTNKNAPKVNLNILLEKDVKKKNEFYKKFVDYPLNFNLFKCNYNKCEKNFKNMIYSILKVIMIMKKLKRDNVIVYDDNFYKEFDDLLKKQQLSDEELKELMNKFLLSTLNMSNFK